nr:hypothetical protein Itr_chr13CG15920 [Ipomoea trifida]
MRTKESDGSSGSSTNLVLNDPIEALNGSFGAILVKKRFTVGICDRKEPSLNLVSGGGVRIAADVGGRNST